MCCLLYYYSLSICYSLFVTGCALRSLLFYLIYRVTESVSVPVKRDSTIYLVTLYCIIYISNITISLIFDWRRTRTTNPYKRFGKVALKNNLKRMQSIFPSYEIIQILVLQSHEKYALPPFNRNQKISPMNNGVWFLVIIKKTFIICKR